MYLEIDVLLLACVFAKFIKVSFTEFGINPLFCVSLLGYTSQYSLKYTDIKLQTFRDEDMILLMENNIKGGISTVRGDRFVKSDDKVKVLFIDANIPYDH